MKEDVVKILEDLVNIQSCGIIDEKHEIIKYLKENFADCLEIVEIKDKNGAVHLLIGVNTELHDVHDCVVLSGHIDTVVPSEGHQPQAIVDGENVTGLGSVDMKAFFASLIANFDELKNSKKPVIISITTDEETQLLGVKSITEEMRKRNIIPGLIIVGEPTSSKYAVSNRGNSVFVSLMNGKACHSSTPELGINAIVLPSKFVLEVEDIARENADDASLAVVSMGGGSAPNIVPDLCNTKISLRTASHSKLTTITEELEIAHDKIGRETSSKLINVFSIPPFERRDCDYVDHLVLKNTKEICEAKFATEAGFFQEAFGDAEIVIYGAGNPDCIHKPGEKLEIRELQNYSQSLSEMVQGYSVFKKGKENERKI